MRALFFRSCWVTGRLLALSALWPLAALAEGGDETIFVDRAPEAGLAVRYFNGMTGELLFPEIMGGGCALFDFDGDGDLDIYLAQGNLLRPERASLAVYPLMPGEAGGDRLWRNDGWAGDAPHFVDVSRVAGIDRSGYGMGVAAADFDNDGWQDLYVMEFGPNRLLRNSGDGRFEDRTASAGAEDPEWSTTAAWFDYDADGWLDLFVGNYSDYTLATHKPCFSESGELDYCGPSVFPPAPDTLFRNRGDGSFERRTKRAGLGATFGPALGAVTGDFNADGWLDLYVANDGVANQLWMNRGDGGLVDEAVLAGVAVNAAGEPEASMGVVAADLTDDGVEDLFMTHLTRETNTLYLGAGSGYFDDASAASGLAMASWKNTGFGIGLADFDLDGRLDMFIANGAVRRVERLAREGDPYPLAQPNQYFRGLGFGRFEEASEDAGRALGRELVSRGVATGDIDNDGDADLLVVNSEGPLELLQNRRGDGREWLGVSLLTASGAPALGAEIRSARLDGGEILRRVGTDGSYASSRDPRVILAAVSMASARQLDLRRLGGRRQRLSAPPRSTYLVVPDR